MKILSLIFVVFLLNSCMKLYSYPGGNMGNMQNPNMKAGGPAVNYNRVAPPNMNGANQVPPGFQKQMMQMNNRPLVNQNKPQALAPNSVNKYPQNVPYPDGMKRAFRGGNSEDKAIKDLENLSKPQYRGGNHYRSNQFQESLND